MIHSLLFLIFCSTLSFAYIDPSKAPMTKDVLSSRLRAGKATTLDQVPGLLPEEFRLNFVLKHGMKIKGERGHLFEEKVSQSADPELPRAIIFDERSGFTVSYNGGGPAQTSPHRLDLLSFDQARKTFSLEEINFPLAKAGEPVITTSNCLTCHGPHGRPIFSMYPDWPSFYGSDNDELLANSAIQREELNDYLSFIREAGSSHPRYRPLYDEKIIKARVGLDRYRTFPFRYELKVEQDDPSRAFAFRPGLRMGILYNRLMAQHLAKRVQSHPNFARMGKFFLYNLLQCGPLDSTKSRAILTRTNSELQKLGRPAGALKDNVLMDYRAMWKMFDMNVNDVDIRYSYNHPGYAATDASREIMGVGYIGNYFNSYFDGSATIDELLSAQLYSYFAARHPGLQKKVELRGLTTKYGRFTARMRFDANFFREMDAKSLWIPIPYPESIKDEHHRENFLDKYRTEHANVCSTLSDMLWWPTKP